MAISEFIKAFAKKDGEPKTTKKVEKSAQGVKKSKEKVVTDVPKNTSPATKKEDFTPKGNGVDTPKKSQGVKPYIPNTIGADNQIEVDNQNVPVEDKGKVSNQDSARKEKVIKPYIHKPLKKVNLTIFLIENTTEVASQKEIISRLIRKQHEKGLITIINYGATVKQSTIYDLDTDDEIVFLCEEGIGNNSCLYDALEGLDTVVFENYLTPPIEKEKERIVIESIDVIGIGTCKDNCSKNSKEVGIDYLCKVSAKTKLTTKYICLTEKSFVDAAELGFHSIAAISQKY